MSVSELQKYTLVSRYSNYIPEEKRRETWGEITDRVMGMHREKFDGLPIDEELEVISEAFKKKAILGSQRALQFGGKPIHDKNARLYNCCASYCDRVRFFQEAFYLLLCGCGTGFSVQKHHIDELPEFSPRDDNKSSWVYVIPDSIEGWADSLGVLLSSYFGGLYRSVNIVFDYSLIRPEGAPLSSSNGKAPGPEPLRKALEAVRALLERCLAAGQTRLRPIDAYDIVMHTSDAVLAGGVRRSATICLFSVDDDEMAQAKTGDWFITNPQRGRSNNSAVLIRNKTTKKQFKKLMKWVKEFGEPGFYFTNDPDIICNPCQPKWAKVLTPEGIREFGDLSEGDTIWSETGWTKVLRKWSTGIKSVYRYETSAGVFYGTDKHRIISNGEKIEVGEAESIDALRGPLLHSFCHNPQDVMDGLVIGDGTKGGGYTGYLCIGDNDSDYLTSEVRFLIDRCCDGYTYKVVTTISPNELPKVKFRRIPKRFINDPNKAAGFLRGLFSANGSVVADGKRVVLKTSSEGLVEDVQLLLSSVGIRSYKTVNKAHMTTFENGDYMCAQSYDINITGEDKDRFAEIIGFIQNYKNEKIVVGGKTRKNTFDIITIDKISEEEVFDITVDNETHTYWTQNCNVSNCVEIGFYCYWFDDYVEDQSRVISRKRYTGWHFCNLTEINGSKCKTYEDFLSAGIAASYMGTLQAAYSSFPYLGWVTEKIVKAEALLGVSITGMMDNPNILFNPENQRQVVSAIRKANESLAKKIGINPAARYTCIKPSGTASCLLGSSSGIHPHHALRYLRLVQSNKREGPFQYFSQINPRAVENSVWCANNSTGVIAFCIEVAPGAKVKNQLSALDLLDKVRSTQQFWVLPGTVKERCLHPELTHNVSNTINVKPEEWDEVEDYIYKNRDAFAGISLLPITGDKDYAQAPFCAVYNPHEMIKYYGDGALFCSGLIDDALLHWQKDGEEVNSANLWRACECATGLREFQSMLQKDWICRLQRYAFRYFGGDVKKATYCLKDVFNWKRFIDLKREYQAVDYSKMIEGEDSIEFVQEPACAGGACLV